MGKRVLVREARRGRTVRGPSRSGHALPGRRFCHAFAAPVGLLLGLLALLMLAPAASAADPLCPNPISTSPDGTTVYGSPCAGEIVVTSPQVKTIHAGAGNNVVYAGPNVEAIYGEGGNDTIYAGPGTVVVEGGEGEDTIYGEPTEIETGKAEGKGIQYEPASASARRREGRRLLRAAQRARHQNAIATISTEIICTENPCLGGDGDQILRGGPENDEIFGERGNDEIYGEGGNDALYGGVGDDKLWGGEGNDFIAGGGGADEIFGEGGNDLVRGDGTIDKLYGGTGTDTLSFSTAVTPGFGGSFPADVTHVEGFPSGGEGRGVFVRLDGGTTPCGYPDCNGGAGLGGGNDETVAEVENVIGSPFADVIVGSSAANKIYGGGGADVIIGGGGADELFGGAEGDYLEGSGEATAYGGTGTNNCVGVGSKNECSGTEARVAQHEAATMSAGLMVTRNPTVAHDSAYLVGSEGNDEVNAKVSGTTVTFSSYGTTRFAGESEGCSYSEEGKKATCTLPEGAPSLDAIVMAGMNGNDHLAVGGGGFELITSPQLLGGEGNDTLIGGGTTEDILVDGNGAGADLLKGYGYDDWLLNNEGTDTLEGGAGNDLFLSSTTCDGDTLNGAEEGSGGDGEARNNASWAKLPASVGGVTADLETQSSGSYWNEASHAPGCSSGSVDHLYGMDDLEGSNQSDALFGNGAENHLLGHKGEDVLYGEGGPDWIQAQDEERDSGSGGEGSDTCYIDLGIDEISSCNETHPSPATTTSTPSVSPHNGQPGSVTVSGHVAANASLAGTYVNVNLSKLEHGEWVLKDSLHPSLNSSGNYEASEVVGVGEWRVKTVFPAQRGFEQSESAYVNFTINPTGYTTETFLTIDSVVNGQPGSVSLHGNVKVTSAEGGPINGLYVNVNFEKEEGGSWVYKSTAQPTISNGYYEVKGRSVGVGNWRTRAVFPQQGYYLSSQSEYHYFTINK